MKTLKRIRYNTMNSWNLSTAPAYNLKIYNVIDNNLQDKVYEIMECQELWDDINWLIGEFDAENEHVWQAGFNGRSGGYLVLYKGGKHENGQAFSYPGKNIDNNEVPGGVLRSFRRLAVNIVKTTESYARGYKVENETYTVEKTRKVLVQD